MPQKVDVVAWDYSFFVLTVDEGKYLNTRTYRKCLGVGTQEFVYKSSKDVEIGWYGKTDS